MLLTTSPSTIKRDVQLLRQLGLFIMTRGSKHDTGPGLSHKTTILDLNFNGYTFSEIEQKTNHSETSVKRYLADFAQVATLYTKDFSPQQIRMIAKKSDRLVREYIQLYQTFEKQDNQRLQKLLTPEKPGSQAKKNPMLNHYGYDKGEITARAIIDDLLKLIDSYYLVSTLDNDLHYINHGQLVYMAVPVDEYPKRDKAIAQTRVKPVV